MEYYSRTIIAISIQQQFPIAIDKVCEGSPGEKAMEGLIMEVPNYCTHIKNNKILC